MNFTSRTLSRHSLARASLTALLVASGCTPSDPGSETDAGPLEARPIPRVRDGGELEPRGDGGGDEPTGAADLFYWGRGGIATHPEPSVFYEAEAALGSSEAVVSSAAVSPNGSMMAIATRLTDPSSRASLWLAPLDGSDAPRLLYQHGVSIYIDFEQLEWSPDGQWLGFTSVIPGGSEPVGGTTVFAVSVATGDLYRVTPTVPAPADAPNGYDEFLSFALSRGPGGSYVASLKNPSAMASPTGIWVTELRDTSIGRSVRVFDTARAHPQWDVSGRVYTISEDLDGSRQLLRALPDGTSLEAVPLTLGREDVRELAISPNGRELAFVQGSDLYLGEVDGTEARLVASDVHTVVWSHDGQLLAFNASAGLAVCPVEGGEPVVVLANRASGGVAWDGYIFSPDSRSLYVRYGSTTLYDLRDLGSMAQPSDVTHSLRYREGGLTFAGHVLHP